MCGSEPVMGVLENSISNNHSSVGSSSDKCAFSNSGNSAENVTKKDIQEFSHVLSNPCQTVFSSESEMFKPQFQSHVNTSVLKMARLNTSLKKIFCLELLSVFLRS